MLVEKDRLMMLVIVGRRTDEHCFSREVGSIVTGAKVEKCGGVTGGEEQV